LHVHEAMACGRPVIACRYSGTAEFFNSSCGWEIAYDEVPATGIMYEGLGNWAMPRHDSMVDALGKPTWTGWSVRGGAWRRGAGEGVHLGTVGPDALARVGVDRLIITTLHYNRPDCTRRCLEALSRCRGIEDCRLIAHTDGGPNRSQEVADLLQQRPFCDTQVCFHPDHLGFDQATFQTLRDGFVDADFVVHIEDDILLAPDALEWFAWARDRYRDDRRS